MKTIQQIIRDNKTIILFFGIILLILILLFSGNPGADLSPAIKDIEKRMEAERLELLDSIAVTRTQIDAQKKEIQILRKSVRDYATEIEKIKLSNAFKKDNITNMGVDDIVSESARSLSE